MGWYGIFLVSKLKLAFQLRSIDENRLFSNFDLLDRFFDKYDKLREDLDYIQEIAEQSRTFSAKTTAKMFNMIEEINRLPECSHSVFLLYFLHKFGFEINCYYEGKINIDNLRKRGWNIIE